MLSSAIAAARRHPFHAAALACLAAMFVTGGAFVVLATLKYSVDFPVYYLSAQRFLDDPLTLYDVVTAKKLAGFTYPPLGVLLFLPFAPFPMGVAHVLFQLVNVAALFLACFLVLRTRRALHPEAPGGAAHAAFFTLLVAGSGPSLSSFALSQVGPVLIALSVGAVYLSRHGRPVLAGLCLAFACWAKMYPTLLLFAMLATPSHRRTALIAMAFGALLPIAMLWLIPVGLYKQYFLELMPIFGKLVTISTDNHGIVGLLTRLTIPMSQWTAWNLLGVAPWVRAVNVLALLLAIALLVSGRVRRCPDILLVSLLALCFIPVVAPLGWSHSFLFSILLVAYCAVFPASRATQVAAVVAWLLMLVPGHWNPGFLETAPAVVKVAQFLRYPAAVAIILVVGARLVLGANPALAPAAPARPPSA